MCSTRGSVRLGVIRVWVEACGLDDGDLPCSLSLSTKRVGCLASLALTSYVFAVLSVFALPPDWGLGMKGFFRL